MKKILILIMVLVLGVVACSSPTSIKNNGNNSDVNDNISVKPPVGDGSGSEDEDNENNNDGGNGGVTPPPPQPEPEPEPQPPVVTPPLEQRYKGLALRIARFNESVIGKTFRGINPGASTGYQFKIDKDGGIALYFLNGSGSVENKQYNVDHAMESSTRPVVIYPSMMEYDPNAKKYVDSINSKITSLNTIRVRLVNWADNESSSAISTSRVVVQIEFRNDYTEAVVKRSVFGHGDLHDLNDIAWDGGTADTVVKLQN